MRAVRVPEPTGPSAVVVADIDDVTAGDDEVLIEAHSVGISFPDLLLSKGQYQLKPEPPFTLGVDFAGTVVSAPADRTDLPKGARVAGVLPYGGAAELVAAPANAVFRLPDEVSFDEGAAIPMNYLTAHFALAERGGMKPGESVLIHGAAGGVGTATIQIALGLGVRPIAVVSTEEKAEIARQAGAEDVVMADGFKDAVMELTEGKGVNAVLDVVGGDVFTDSLRCLAEQGRLLVVGFAAGTGIPEVKVNRLLLNNVDVRGVGWGAYAMARSNYMQEQWHALQPMMERGLIKPPIGATYEIEEFGQALVEMEDRKTLGKSIVHLR